MRDFVEYVAKGLVDEPEAAEPAAEPTA